MNQISDEEFYTAIGKTLLATMTPDEKFRVLLRAPAVPEMSASDIKGEINQTRPQTGLIGDVGGLISQYAEGERDRRFRISPDGKRALGNRARSAETAAVHWGLGFCRNNFPPWRSLDQVIQSLQRVISVHRSETMMMVVPILNNRVRLNQVLCAAVAVGWANEMLVKAKKPRRKPTKASASATAVTGPKARRRAGLSS